MKKRIQLFTFLSFLFFNIYAVDGDVASDFPVTNGYYQTIDLDDNTPCNCNEKTQRMYDMTKGLYPKDVIKYELHPYKISLGNSYLAAPKLFKALENDRSVYKVSLIDWKYMMLLTTKDFDALSFETAALKVFSSFSKMQADEFLKLKNMESYNEYMIEKEKTNKN